MTYAMKRAEELTKLERESKVDVTLEFSSYKKIPLEKRSVYNASYLFLQKIYHEIGLHKIASKISRNYSFKYDLDSILSRLIYTRILEPSSKKSSFEASKKLIEQPNFELHQMYRALEVLCKEKEMIQSEVYKNSLKAVKRNTNILYYDCTNFFFEINEEDDFRKYGVSKENRPNPIVQFGMFLDGSGIPLAFNIALGNTSEQKMLRPLEQQILKDFEAARFIKTLHYTENGEAAYKNVLSLDEEKILSEMDYDGLYAVSTNLEGDVSDILKITKRRWEIEESFCIMKSELNARLVYLSVEERITAHFLTCFLSLLIFRILEKKLGEKHTCYEIIDTLRDMNVREEHTGDYTPAFTRTELTDDLFKLFGFDLSMEVTTNLQMKEILKESKRK